MKLLRVLFASPGDTSEERATARRIVEELNQIWGEYSGVLYRALMWEADSYTATAEDGQAVINRELGDDYQVFVGIMRARFGSPTKRAPSGTKEEYERAYSRLRPDPGAVEIGFYFCNAPVSREELVGDRLDQLLQVLAFQSEVRDRGTLTQDYTTIEEFETHLRLHLSKLMQRWADRLLPSSEKELSGLITETVASQPREASPPLQLLTAETLVEDLQAASFQIRRAGEIQHGMMTAIHEYSQTMDVHREILEAATESNDMLEIQRALTESQEAQAAALAAIGDAIGSGAIPLAQNTRGTLLTGSRVAMYTAATGDNVEGTRYLGTTIEWYGQNLEKLFAALSEWRDSMERMSVPTLEIFRNREYCTHAMDVLLAETRNLTRLARQVAAALHSA